ncbi:hypothetical protein [Nocardia sp. NPDC050175]|uniref:hypothetical protein n=1 Tax=Nocardia sp. NPDC050175 TaxID=3364317 RepID=UPI0037976116
MERLTRTRDDLVHYVSITEECPYRSIVARMYYFEGMADGMILEVRWALQRALDDAGLIVPWSLDSRIDNCWDLELLNSWIDRVATAKKVEEIFSE